MSSKVCFKCLQPKPLEAFYRHPRMGDGRLGKCIECTKADVIQNRIAKIEYYRSYDRQRASLPHRVVARKKFLETLSGKLARARATANYAVTYAIRKQANIATGNAIRDGRLKRLPCFVCGEKAQAHHPDYSSPMAVSWLCPKHHAQTHKEHRQRLREAA